MSLILTPKRQKQGDHCELEASPVYKVSSRLARMQRDPVSNNKQSHKPFLTPCFKFTYHISLARITPIPSFLPTIQGEDHVTTIDQLRLTNQLGQSHVHLQHKVA